MKSRAGWVVMDFLKGDRVWEGRIAEGDVGVSVAYADGRIYVYGEKTANCYLIDPTVQ